MEQDISLREIIDTIWNGKWIIVGITALFGIIAFIYSFFIANPVYESKATIIINHVEQPIGSLNEYVNNATSTELVVEVINSPEVIQETIEQLGLDTSVNSFQNKLTVKTSGENETLISIKYQDIDRDKATKVINHLIANAKISIIESVDSYITSYESLYDEKMEEEQENLNLYLQEYDELEELGGLPLLVLFQQNASESQYILEANEDLLSELRNLDKSTQVEYDQLNAKISHSNTQIKQYYEYYKDAVNAKSLDLVDERISVFSNAYASSDPISPNKTLNMAVALIIGVMISLLVVFLVSYLKNTNTNKIME